MSKIGDLRELLLGLLREHERDGAIPTNARFLYYELVQRGQLSKERTGARRPDQDLHDALTDIREDGGIPWDWIIDETRSVEDYTGYPSIKQGVLAKLPYIKLDPWRGRAPLILTESRSLAGVLRSVVSEYRARIASTNGQCGGFLRTDIAPLLRPDDDVGYLGDLDLSGGHIEDNTRRVLEREIGGELRWERIALTAEQVEQYDLPKIVKHDRRYKDGRPHEAVETEAIKQTVLIEILRRGSMRDCPNRSPGFKNVNGASASAWPLRSASQDDDCFTAATRRHNRTPSTMINRTSGYDPGTGICWQFRNKGDRHWRCKCPVCSGPRPERSFIMFGRYRSGQRWFWKAYNFTLTSDRHLQTGVWEQVEEHGFEDTEEAAWAKIQAAVIRLAANRPAIAAASHGIASNALKELNAAKRRARPPSEATDSKVVEYLYGYSRGGEDSPGHPVRYRITKKTAKRVFYVRHEEWLDERGELQSRQFYAPTDDGRIGFVNRQKLDADGNVYNRGVHWCCPDFHLYVSLEACLGNRYREEKLKPEDIRQLKAAMAAAHPDRGGSSR